MSIKNQIINYLLLKIQQDGYDVGTRLPSEQALAIKFNCNRHTVRSALSPLRSAGVIEFEAGRGNVLKYSLVKLYANQAQIQYNDYHIVKLDYQQLPISMLKYYEKECSCYKEIYYFNAKVVGYAYVILSDPRIKVPTYQSLFKLFSNYKIVIKKIQSQLQVIENHGRYLDIKYQNLVKSNLLFFKSNHQIIGVCMLIVHPRFFKANAITQIF